MAMLDVVMTLAAMCATRLRQRVVNLEIKTSFVTPATATTLTGIGTVRRLGRLVVFLEGELYQDDHRLIATASSTAIPVQIEPRA